MSATGWKEDEEEAALAADASEFSQGTRRRSWIHDDARVHDGQPGGRGDAARQGSDGNSGLMPPEKHMRWKKKVTEKARCQRSPNDSGEDDDDDD